eukprot:scaffold336061_cov18-Prasinocladus_malaysianus.AAC.1
MAWSKIAIGALHGLFSMPIGYTMLMQRRESDASFVARCDNVLRLFQVIGQCALSNYHISVWRRAADPPCSKYSSLVISTCRNPTILRRSVMGV